MTRARIAGGAFAIVLILLAVAAAYRARDREVEPAAAESATSSANAPSVASAAAKSHPAAATLQGFLYGRVVTVDGATLEGRLRWGGDQEAFWGDYFNGSKRENRWLAHVPQERTGTNLEEPPSRSIGPAPNLAVSVRLPDHGEPITIRIHGQDVALGARETTDAAFCSLRPTDDRAVSALCSFDVQGLLDSIVKGACVLNGQVEPFIWLIGRMADWQRDSFA